MNVRIIYDEIQHFTYQRQVSAMISSGQDCIMDAVLAEKDVLDIMPTGPGKSSAIR